MTNINNIRSTRFLEEFMDFLYDFSERNLDFHDEELLLIEALLKLGVQLTMLNLISPLNRPEKKELIIRLGLKLKQQREKQYQQSSELLTTELLNNLKKGTLQ